MKKIALLACLLAAMPFVLTAQNNDPSRPPRPEMNRGHTFDTMRYSISGSLMATSKTLSGVTEIRMYDASTMRFLRKLFIQGNQYNFAILPDDSGLCYTYDNKLHHFDFFSEKDAVMATADPIDKTCAAFSPDGKKFAAVGNSEACIVSYPEGKILSRFSYGGREYKLRVKFSHDGNLVAMGGPEDQGILCLYSLAKGTVIKLGGLFSGHKGSISDICFSADDALLASCGGWGDQKAFVWECTTGKAKASCTTKVQGGFRAVHIKDAVSPVLLLTRDKTFCTLDISSEKFEEKKMKAETPSLDDTCVFSPDGEQFAYQ
ncbi:MAG: WD40 repeat domain-containing protein, partial [Spirochaetota bacterium]